MGQCPWLHGYVAGEFGGTVLWTNSIREMSTQYLSIDAPKLVVLWFKYGFNYRFSLWYNYGYNLHKLGYKPYLYNPYFRMNKNKPLISTDSGSAEFMDQGAHLISSWCG